MRGFDWRELHRQAELRVLRRIARMSRKPLKQVILEKGKEHMFPEYAPPKQISNDNNFQEAVTNMTANANLLLNAVQTLPQQIAKEVAKSVQVTHVYTEVKSETNGHNTFKKMDERIPIGNIEQIVDELRKRDFG